MRPGLHVLFFLMIWQGSNLMAFNHPDSLQRVYFDAPNLGTRLSITCYIQDSSERQSIEDQCWQLVDSLNMVFSDYNQQSEASLLQTASGTNTYVKVSDPLFDLTEKSIQIAAETEGKFDISIGPLTKLWRSNLSNEKIPSKREVKQAKKKVDYQKIVLDAKGQRLSLQQPGMSLDFGGIAKGYIGDLLASLLRKKGIECFLIDMGGDLVAGNPPPGKDIWELNIPWTNQVIGIANQAVATSGPDYQFFVHKGKKYTHIIDPFTGWGVDQPFSATVIAPYGWQADALASVSAILPSTTSLSLVEKKPEVEYALGLGDVYQESPGFRKFVQNISKK